MGLRDVVRLREIPDAVDRPLDFRFPSCFGSFLAEAPIDGLKRQTRPAAVLCLLPAHKTASRIPITLRTEFADEKPDISGVVIEHWDSFAVDDKSDGESVVIDLKSRLIETDLRIQVLDLFELNVVSVRVRRAYIPRTWHVDDPT